MTPNEEQVLPIIVGMPAYNEEVAIASVILRARPFARQVVVVDDGSKDSTVEVAALAGARVVRHERNKGYGGALKTLFALAKKENWPALCIVDSDGQHDPKDIPRVAAPVLAGEADIAIGSRFVQGAVQEDIPAYRKAGIKVLTGLSNVGAGAAATSDGQSGFRVYGRKAIESLDLRDSDMGISAEILFEAREKNLRLRDVPIHVRYDVDGSSKNPISHGFGVIGSILRYVERRHPLLIFGLPGFVSLIVGLVLGTFSLSVYVRTHFLPFGPTLAAGILAIGGMMLGMTGLILHAVVQVGGKK